MSLRALLLGQRLDTRGLQHLDTLAATPLTLRTGDRGMAILFRFGVVALVGTSASEEIALLDSLRDRVVERLERPETEQVALVVDPAQEERVDPSGNIVLKDSSIEKLQIVADVLAKSVVLAHHESQIAATFDRMEPLALDMKRRGRANRKARQLISQVGDMLLTQHRRIGRVAVEDKPDVLWDRPELDRLYSRLADEYDLSERSLAIDRKFSLVDETIRTLLELVQNQRTVRLEWYIIILIAFDIVLSLIDKLRLL